MQEEIWKDIEEFEGLYQVSNLGRVKRLKGTHYLAKLDDFILKGRDCRGYLKVDLSNKKHKKQMYIHRLVAIAFILNPLNKPTVNHLDNNPLNNKLSNLEWATTSEQRAHQKKMGYKYICLKEPVFLTIEDVIIIKQRLLNGDLIKYIALDYNVHRSTISDIKSGKHWSNLKPKEDKLIPIIRGKGYRKILFKAIRTEDNYSEISNSITAFANKYTLNKDAISQCINKRQRQHKGWIFEDITN
jgi:hypothetical protein